MRYSASEKAEIIRLVGQSALPVKRTLEKLGIPRATFYRWYDLYQSGGPEALDDLEPHAGRYPRADRAAGPGRARLIAARVGRALHRYGKVFRVRGFGLSPAEGRMI
jgi:transposase-like protein